MKNESLWLRALEAHFDREAPGVWPLVIVSLLTQL